MIVNVKEPCSARVKLWHSSRRLWCRRTILSRATAIFAIGSNILARKIAPYGFAPLAVSFLFGSTMLDRLGISLFAVESSG